MGILDFFRKRPEDQVVVFAGDRMEAELVKGILEQEGFHPDEWADLPAPAYVGPIGMARIVVPPHEGAEAKALIESLKDGAEGAREADIPPENNTPAGGD